MAASRLISSQDAASALYGAGLLRPLLRLSDQEQPVREIAGRVSEAADFREQLRSRGLAVTEQPPDQMLRDLPDGQTAICRRVPGRVQLITFQQPDLASART